MMLIQPIFWILIAFIAGSIPFSVLIGRFILGKDIRRYGDGNPGGSNVVRAGSRFWGVAAILLDFFKGAIPVSWTHFFIDLPDWALIMVALAPVLGHAYSPFLKFHGGKAVAVTFGVWAGLTLWAGPMLLGISLGFYFAVLTVEGWIVMASMGSLLVYLVVFDGNPVFLAVWMGNASVLAWKHREDLTRLPGLRPWLRQVIHS